jgi:hypothetical protein
LFKIILFLCKIKKNSDILCCVKKIICIFAQYFYRVWNTFHNLIIVLIVKKMKKVLLFAAFVAMVAFSSCKKAAPVAEEAEAPVIEAEAPAVDEAAPVDSAAVEAPAEEAAPAE